MNAEISVIIKFNNILFMNNDYSYVIKLVLIFISYRRIHGISYIHFTLACNSLYSINVSEKQMN